jgi:hypothetical protein
MTVFGNSGMGRGLQRKREEMQEDHMLGKISSTSEVAIFSISFFPWPQYNN